MDTNGIWSLDEARAAHMHSQVMADYLAGLFEPCEPCIDIGCGTGFYLRRLQDAGFTSLIGFEGTPGIEAVAEFRPIVQADLTQPLDCAPGQVICLEVGEHLLASAERTLVESIARCKRGRAVVSWAVPGQPGLGHVNCKSQSAVARLFRECGLRVDWQRTMDLRAKDFGPGGWFFNGSVFVLEE